MTNIDDKKTVVQGARFVQAAGYNNCIELNNGATRVVLEPNLGGRVLHYQFHGKEMLYQNAAQNGVVWDGRTKIRHPSAGRFDIGPEHGGLAHDEFWFGRWAAEITGTHSARLTSSTLKEGLQLVREFKLDSNSSHLHCKQIVRNHGRSPARVFHWSRTFVAGNGIALAPLPERGRFLRGYALGGPANVINFEPAEEKNVRIRESILEILGPPENAKFIFDVNAGWLAYLSPNDLLFLKKFPVYANRAYGEIAANNASIWYGSKENFASFPDHNFPVEIEPIGPLEIIEPGTERSFHEDWWLENFTFPEDRCVDLEKLRAMISQLKVEAA